MRILPTESNVALELSAKTEPGKTDSNDFLALLLAALAGVQVNIEVRTAANNGQETNGEPNAQIEDLLRALPEGTTVEQLLLNLPKESPAISALLLEFSAISESAGEIAKDSQAPNMDLPEMTGEATPAFAPEFKVIDKGASTKGQDLAPETPSTVRPVATVPLEVNSGQPRVEQPVVSVPGQQSPESTLRPQRVDDAPVLSGQVPQVAVPASPSLPVVSAESLQQLRTEIISYSNNPVRPMVTIEVSPPEYGRIVVSAKRDAQGQVTVRLVVETPAAKEALAQQLPQAFAGATYSSTTISIFTMEEYHEYREEQRQRNSDRNKQQRERSRRERPHEVEFVI
ncbi:MAG: hypothetical protein FD169_1172 [Bacillota bacterium]|nr:MAG: hypothetical protein FD169_1172 [Bacillota bacterium]MBS3951264.1 flagellar hook-length control protein FliK [Peptococcaceae bacterium]